MRMFASMLQSLPVQARAALSGKMLLFMFLLLILLKSQKGFLLYYL